MVLSKRERNIVIGTVSIVAGCILYWYVVDPLVKHANELRENVANSKRELERDNLLIRTSQKLTPKWKDMQNTGLHLEPSEANTQLVTSVNAWARESGLTDPSFRDDKTEATGAGKSKDFYQVSIHVGGSGGMAQISRFVFLVQTAKIPVKITEMSINSRKDGLDDLTMQIGLATICMVPEGQIVPGRAAPPAAPREPS